MALRYNIKNNTDTKTYIYFKPTESNDLDDIKLLLENLENDDKIVVYPNNEYVNQYNSYKNVKNYIYTKITNGFFCTGLNPDYILKSFDNVDAVVIIGSSINILPNGNIYGFALINFNQESNSIYIDVICSRTGIEGAGGILINKIEDISRKLFIDSILLTSVDSAIPFYRKYGFTKFESLCDDMCVMIKHINKKFGGKRKTNKEKQ